MSSIVMIGAGRAAWALGRGLVAAGHEIVQVWSRSLPAAVSLATHCSALFTTDLTHLDTNADFYLLAVSDDAAPTVAAQIKLQHGIIAHTSGVLDTAILQHCGVGYGVLYPFVSMSKERAVDFTEVTIMIESTDESVKNSLTVLAQSLSNDVRNVTGKQRNNLHLAAVFANNFTNHLYHIAEQLLREHDLTFDEIRPLIRYHADSLEQHLPSRLQTGVALRDDTMAMQKHQQLLSAHPDYQRLYAMLSASIQQLNHTPL